VYSCKTILLDKKYEWDELIRISRTATFFQQKKWLENWVKCFPVRQEIVGIFDEKVLVGIAPFSYDQGAVYLLGTTPVLGSELVCDFGDIICQPNVEKNVWMSVLNYLSTKHTGKILDFSFVKENSFSFDFLKPLSKKIVPKGTSPYLDLSKSWEGYLSGLKRKNRHEIRRKLRRLERVNYRGYQVDPTEVNRQVFFKLMRRSSFEKEKFLSKPMEAFFSGFLTGLNKGQIFLWFMDIEDKTVASVLAFKAKDELLLYNSGMDLDYQQLSVGLMSKVLLIKKSIELGYKKFDFLRGDERYKYDLGAVDNKLYQLTLELGRDFTGVF